MQINVTYDASVGGAPAGFTTAIDYVVNLFDAAFTNNVTININVGWGEVNGFALDKNALGESIESGAAQYHYADIISALAGESSAVQQLANASLPLADPTNGHTFDIGSADAKALGLIAGNSAAVDGWVGFDGTASDWSFTPNVIPAANTYDIIGTIEHEFTEIMGRDALVGTQYHYPKSFTVMDLFRYSAPGVRSLAPGAANSTAYFSLDNGVTNSGTWNNHNGNGDLGDWYPAGPATNGNDAFNDYSNSGVLNVLSPSDLLNMYAIGWNPSAPPPVITSITSTPAGGAVPLSGHVVIDLITSAPVFFNPNGDPNAEATLRLSDNGTAFYNVLTSTTTDLKFDYFAQSGENTADLKVTSLLLTPGAEIQDLGNGADLYPGLPSGSDLHLVVDTIVPTVSRISVTPSGAVANGGDVKFTLTMSEAVTAAAGAKLTLNDGGVATYTSGSNSNTLVFDYHVGAESTTDLKITGLDQTGGQITDLAGNAVSSALVYDTALMVNVFRFVNTMNGGGGSWNNGANWSPASVPGANDTALLMAKGTYAARSMQDNSVGILNIAKTATLDIRSNEFDITGGTGTGAIAGNIKVNDGASLSIANTMNNTGTITLGSTGDVTALIIAGAVVLSGAGHVALTDNLANEIVSDGAAATLTNAGNKIVGAGTIVDANLTLVNEFNGVIDAQGTHSLTIDVAAFTNNGLLESTGDLVISHMTVANSPGGLMAAEKLGAHIDLDSAIVTGGSVVTIAGSFIDTLNGNASTISFAAVTNGGTIRADHGELSITGAVTNNGVLAADNGSTLDIAGAVGGKGTGTIAHDGILEFGAASSAKATFLDHTGTLQLDSATTLANKFTGTIAGFAHGTNNVDLGAIDFTTGNGQLSFVEASNHKTGVLTVVDGVHTETLTFLGNFTVGDFTTLEDTLHHVDLLHV